MIKRVNYGLEFKQKIGRELSLGNISVSAVSKREVISTQTLKKWRDKYGFEISNTTPDTGSDTEVRELRILVAEYESALGGMALQIHLLKKNQIFASAQAKRRSLSGVISPSTLGLRRAAK